MHPKASGAPKGQTEEWEEKEEGAVPRVVGEKQQGRVGKEVELQRGVTEERPRGCWTGRLE